MFAVGAVAGSAATWMILKSKYEQRIQEEIESVKEAFIEMNCSDEQSEEGSEDEEEEASEEYHQVNWDELEDLDEDESDDELKEYADLTNMYSSEKGGAEKVETQDPYVIEPMEFGEAYGYKTVSYTYYADGILEDNKHKIVTNIDELIGKGSLDTFGDYEEDSVFVRNPRLRTDFEILKDYNTYEEATGNTPDRVRGK